MIEPGAPASILIDPDQNEGAVSMPFEMAQLGLLGFQGHQAAQLRFRCSFCESEWTQPADQPVPVRIQEGLHAECAKCRQLRRLINPAAPDPPGTFRILTAGGGQNTDPQTGEPLIFLAANYKTGRMGALHQAARKAGALQKGGETVILKGDGEHRRYAPEYLQFKAAKRWPYRVACVNFPQCGNWVHPVQPEGAEGRCSACWASSDTAKENGRRATRQRLEKDDAAG